ncbi:hypothetical protein MIMGU_mgv1a016717mg [Erythranthe guttata]|uniref:Uncharacterized protein n=1 Tax=Erythranthe guttata TaxID=4155 RepID=A0A022R338_ERYGU|nr:hypothetical protein MIMGU_mgv1a016717mg [Erythranthe guttata]
MESQDNNMVVYIEGEPIKETPSSLLSHVPLPLSSLTFFFLPTSCSSFFFTKSTIISSHFLLHSSVDFSPIHFLNGEIAAFHLQRIVPRREQQRRHCCRFVAASFAPSSLN